MTEKITKTRTIEHPLESVLDVERNTTIVEYKESPPGELVVVPEYDTKDIEIEGQLEEIRAKAIDAFDAQQDITETVDGKYASRSGEVAAQFLNTALAAVQAKSNQKQHKDKLVTVEKGSKTTNNLNIITADRNDILRALATAKNPPLENT